jgi:hypothetical protein
VTTPPPAWPLVLAGPMPRRVEPEAVSVFVACSRPRAVRLSIYQGTLADPERLVGTAEAGTVPLGASLHVAVVTASPPVPLARAPSTATTSGSAASPATTARPRPTSATSSSCPGPGANRA